MLDQCSIQVVCAAKINPDVFSNRTFRIGNAVLPSAKAGFKHHSRPKPQEHASSHDGDDESFDDEEDDDEEQKLERRATGRIDIFEDNALVVFTRNTRRPAWQGSEKPTDHHYVNNIFINPAKILHGHNGHTLQTEAAICLALTYARHALSAILIKPNDSFRLIPGTTRVPGSYWRSLEIAMNIRDKDKVIYRQMANMRSPAIRSRAVREQNTVYQRGSKFTLKAYDKVAHIKTKRKPKLEVHDDTDEITRLELVAKAQGLVLADGITEPDGSTFHRFGATRRLVSFNMDFLRNLHREKFSNLKAVYMKEPGTKSTKEGYAVLLAALSLERDIPVADIVELFGTAVKRTESACRTLRTAIEDAISQSSTLDANELLKDGNYVNQPGVSVIHELPYYQRLPAVVAADPEISGPYATQKGVSQIRFLNDLADYQHRRARR